jgi:hypothetical protein
MIGGGLGRTATRIPPKRSVSCRIMDRRGGSDAGAGVGRRQWRLTAQPVMGEGQGRRCTLPYEAARRSHTGTRTSTGCAALPSTTRLAVRPLLVSRRRMES